MLPELLPWLAVLSLLMLKPNRTAHTWWVWLPLVCLATSETIARTLLGSIPSEVRDIFCQTFNSLGFGIAAVWLLTPFLGHRLRFLVFLKMLGAMVAISAMAYLARQDWQEPGLAIGFLVYVGVCVSVAVTGLSLAGLICRRQYRPFALTLWAAVFIMALWLVISAPFFVIALVSSGGEAPWLEFVGFILAFAALTFGVILPFLVLAFANGFFRERLKQLFHLGEATCPPPILAAPPPVLSPPNAI